MSDLELDSKTYRNLHARIQIGCFLKINPNQCAKSILDFPSRDVDAKSNSHLIKFRANQNVKYKLCALVIF